MYRIEISVDAKDKAEAIAWLKARVASIGPDTADQAYGGGGGGGPSVSFYMGPKRLSDRERIARLEELTAGIC